MSFDAFIKIDGVDGESTDSKHGAWIELLGYEHTAEQPSSGSTSSSGAYATGRVELSRFKITKAIDLTTPVLYNKCTLNENIPTVTMELCRATGDKETYYVVTLTNVKVASLSCKGVAKGAKASPLPTEVVELAYSKIAWVYTQTDHATGAQGGVTEAEWDVTTNA